MNGSLLNPSGNRFMNVLYNSSSESSENQQRFTKELKLLPKQTTDVEVPVESAQNFGVTFIANPNVSVSLNNDKGVIVSKNSADSPLVNSMFRMVLTNKPVTKSLWKIRIENTSQTGQIFAGFAWSTESLPVAKQNAAE
jgi:hypothetical protein